MALDWEFIQNVQTKELTDDQAEILYDQIIQYNVNGSESIEQLKKLFDCSKLVMQVKANQADVAIEELEEVISRETSNQKAIKSNLYKDDLAVEHNEQQLLELERANELLRNQLREKDAELNRSEQSKLNLEQTLKSKEKQLQNYKQEIEQLREELNEKEQISEHLADNTNLPFEQLRDMNKKFYILLDEMKDLETVNRQLGEKVMKLNQELDSATHQIQTATEEMQYMKNNLNNLQEMNDLLINEKEDHLNEIKKLKTLTSNYELESGENLDSNSKTIQDLLEKLKQKEDELNDLRSQFDSMDRAQIEKERNYFVKEISKRDNHIKLLSNRLSQATDDIEAHIRKIENLMEKKIEIIHKQDSSDGSNVRNDQNQVLNSEQLISKLEEELRTKDKEMTILHQRNTLYEKGIYGLSEAVEEINKLKKLNKSKDNEIDNLIKELNSINLKLSNTQDELDYLKEFMNADEDLKKKLNEESEVKNDKLKILKLQKEVIRLDGEKLKLYEEVLSLKMDSGGGMKKKLDLTDYPMINSNEISQKDDLQDIKELQKLNELQELENENRALQLAMKEILLGLKESDSKSDIVIDCPSLERLCQFFESRSINSNLANVIALKAELDILRGHNEELRMTNKRLKNDNFKIFENYSKQLLGENLNIENVDQNNQTLTEDELYDSDLSEGEIVLNSRSINISSRKKEQQTQTDLIFDNDKYNNVKNNNDEQNDDEHNDDEDKNSISESTNHKKSSPTVNLMDENQLSEQNEIEQNNLNENQLDEQDKNESNELDKNESNKSKDYPTINIDSSTDTDEQNTFTIQKSFNDSETQTEICLDDLENINFLKEINKLKLSKDDLRDLINQKNSIDKTNQNLIETVLKQEASSQTVEIVSETNQETTNCNQCKIVQNLLIEFQKKLDRDSNINQIEDLYSQRVNVLQEENNRLQTELQRIVQIKDELLNQKDKQIIELNDKIVDHKEKIINLEEIIKNKEEIKLDQNEKSKIDSTNLLEQKDQTNQIKVDKQSIDSQLAVINKATVDSTNQKGLINILETIIKCLQKTIEHKDESIANYQKLLIKVQEEHQQKLLKNYKKVTEHSIKAIQSSSNVNQEQLEANLAKYNEQLNEFKNYHQKVLAEQKKAFELQSCKLKRLKSENERLKSQATSVEELNRLRIENENLNKFIEKNMKYIEKLKNAIKEEREFKQDIKNELKQQDKQEEPGRIMLINKMKEEIESLYKLMTSKDRQIKELQLNKWNLEKKISELIQESKTELKLKTEELEKMRTDHAKLKSLLEKLEKERSAQKRKQPIVIKETKNEINKEVQTGKTVSFEMAHDNSMFIDKFRQLDETISALKFQLQQSVEREKELINLLEMKGFKQTNNEVINRPKKENFSIQTIKGKKFEIRKNSCDF